MAGRKQRRPRFPGIHFKSLFPIEIMPLPRHIPIPFWVPEARAPLPVAGFRPRFGT